MNGPEHYREAERLIAPQPQERLLPRSPTTDEVLRGIAHAILALTAATAANIRRNGLVPTDSVSDWQTVIR